jgi:hypothetical protein
MLEEITEDAVHGIKEKTGIEKWSIGLRRIVTTYCVAEAWKLSTTLPDKQEQVPFQKSGHVSSALRFCVTSFLIPFASEPSQYMEAAIMSWISKVSRGFRLETGGRIRAWILRII